MELERVPVSPAVTRYYVTAVVGPHTRVLLVRPNDRSVVAEWHAGGELTGVWISPYPDLEASIDGEDRTPPQHPPVLRLVDGGSTGPRPDQ